MSKPYLPRLDLGLPLLPEHAQFWSYCHRGELRFQRCGSCGITRHPPAPVCSQCHSPNSTWEIAPANAELFSFTIVHHAAAPALRSYVPYNIAVVAFPALGDVRLVSNVLGVANDRLRIGMPLSLIWIDDGNGNLLPLFAADGSAP